MGVDDAGMPLGLQIVGRTGHEADLFQLAREFDAKLQAYRRPDHFLAK
jgi:Asp-tRNA(Asn)/Glu-tRNA(Gln) amidotransferase A subunit family amidase